MGVVIYHNPRCVTSRKTLDLLRSKKVEPKIIEYLKTPPDEAQIKKLLAQLGLTARELLRKREPDYKKLKLDDPSVTDAKIIRAMAEHPVLIERPVVVNGNKAVLGRPPAKALEIL